MITETVNFTIRYDAGNLVGLEIPQTLSAPDHAHAVKYLLFYENVRDAGSLIHGPADAYRIIGPVTITQHRPRLASGPCATGEHGACFGLNGCPCNCHRDDRDGCTCALSDDGIREHGHMTACPQSAAAWRIAEREAATAARGGTAWNAPAAESTFTAKCPECGRVFDLMKDTDAQEWAYGHDCEVN